MITNFLTENVTGDMVLIVQDMVEAADLGLGRIGTFDSYTDTLPEAHTLVLETGCEGSSGEWID